MICRNCLLRLSRHSPSTAPHTFRRALSATSTRQSTPVSINATTIDPRPHGHPAATSTSAAQPFTAGTSTVVPKADAHPRAPSSIVAGTPLRGINFMKSQQDPVAKEDHEYPEWLWSVLDNKSDDAGDGVDGEGDIFSKSKKQRRKAAKAMKKRALADPDSFVPKTPLHEQTVDLPAGNGTLDGAKHALAARNDLTKAMRDARRAKIKEGNFLKAMG